MTEPTKFGRYVVTRVLGRGAMGVVYHAEDPVISRQVAIKVIKAFPGSTDDEVTDLQRRFEREFRAAGTLSHPGIVTVYDVGQEGTESFIAMEYVAGESLEQQMSAGREFSVDDVVALVTEVGAALDHAHGQGVVHRDVKPANIIVSTDNRCRLADFGIATLNEHTLTRDGSQVGTPSFMSPEQVLGAQVSGASDQFSLGVIAYRLLTGERPFSGESMTSVMYQISQVEPPKPSALNPRLPAAMSSAVMRSLSKNPEDRFPSCGDLAVSLKDAVSEKAEVSDADGPSDDDQSSGERWVDVDLHGASTDSSQAAALPPPPPQRARRILLAGAVVVGVAAAGLVWDSGMFRSVPIEAMLSVDTNPPEQALAIWLDDQPLGLSTPSTVQLRGEEGTTVRLDLVRDGAVVASTGVTLGSELSAWVPDVEEPLKPVRYEVTSEPPGGLVSLDGQSIARPTPVDIDLFPGQSYEIMVELDGYEPASVTMDPAEAEAGQKTLDFSLIRIVRPARIRWSFETRVSVVARPANGGRARRANGDRPALDLAPGRYTISVTAPEIFWVSEQTVSVAEGESVPTPEIPDTVTIPVFDNRGDATVRVDDFEPFPVAGPKRIVVGRHRFVFTWPSGEQDEQVVQIERSTRQVAGRHP